jgi:predicted metal-dependent enzyme (double-stranded beta helix superfamily)
MLELTSPLFDLSHKVRLLLGAQSVLGTSFCREIGRSIEPLLATATSWIPQHLLVPQETSYRREVLLEDPLGMFSIAALTWAPGQATRIHDHFTWGVVGIAQGTLRSETYERDTRGELHKRGHDEILHIGAATYTHPQHPDLPDIHRLSSASSEISVSIHIYGCRLSEINRTIY